MSAATAARRHHRWAAAVLLATLFGAVGGCGPRPAPMDQAAAAPSDLPASPAAAAVAGATRPAALVNAANPVRIRVARLGIDAALDPLHLDASGVLVPPVYGRAGWYEAGPEPGELGRAVIAGHVDSKTGPDTFAGLYRARPGDVILVTLADHSTLHFVVQKVGTYAKSAFPTALVYGGPKKIAELRMITCTGPYERSRGGYQDNLVVFARFVG